MLRPTKITGVITQGAKDFGHVQFVGSYKVAYSNNGERWFIYQDEKQKTDKVGFFLSQSHVKNIYFCKTKRNLLTKGAFISRLM